MPISEKLKSAVPTFLKPKETSEITGRTIGTLSVWRSTRRHDLSFYKVGRSVMYKLEDVLEFIERGKVRPKKPR